MDSDSRGRAGGARWLLVRHRCGRAGADVLHQVAPLFGWKRADGTRRFRRRYVEVPKKNGKSTLFSGLSLYPHLAAEALASFQQLYDIEDRALAMSPEDRQALRQGEAVPLLARLRDWAEAQAEASLPKSTLGNAVGYLRNQWEPLTTYVVDGRLPIDNNATERDLRALTIGRRNWLFIGSREAGPRAANLNMVVASASRHNLDVWAYLRDVLERLALGEPNLESLLPDVWAAATSANSLSRLRG
jgi:hypothetical protein